MPSYITLESGRVMQDTHPDDVYISPEYTSLLSLIGFIPGYHENNFPVIQEVALFNPYIAETAVACIGDLSLTWTASNEPVNIQKYDATPKDSAQASRLKHGLPQLSSCEYKIEIKDTFWIGDVPALIALAQPTVVPYEPQTITSVQIRSGEKIVTAVAGGYPNPTWPDDPVLFLNPNGGILMDKYLRHGRIVVGSFVQAITHMPTVAAKVAHERGTFSGNHDMQIGIPALWRYATGACSDDEKRIIDNFIVNAGANGRLVNLNVLGIRHPAVTIPTDVLSDPNAMKYFTRNAWYLSAFQNLLPFRQSLCDYEKFSASQNIPTWAHGQATYAWWRTALDYLNQRIESFSRNRSMWPRFAV